MSRDDDRRVAELQALAESRQGENDALRARLAYEEAEHDRWRTAAETHRRERDEAWARLARFAETWVEIVAEIRRLLGGYSWEKSLRCSFGNCLCPATETGADGLRYCEGHWRQVTHEA